MVAECKVGRASEQVVRVWRGGNFFRLTNDHWDRVGGTAINVRLPSFPTLVVAAVRVRHLALFSKWDWVGVGIQTAADSHVGPWASQIRLSP